MSKNGEVYRPAEMKIQYTSASFHIREGSEGAQQFADVLAGLGPMGADGWDLIQVIQTGTGLAIHKEEHEGQQVETEYPGTFFCCVLKRFTFPFQTHLQAVAGAAATDILSRLKKP